MLRASPLEKGVGGNMKRVLLRPSPIQGTELANARKRAKHRAGRGRKAHRHRWAPLNRPGQRQRGWRPKQQRERQGPRLEGPQEGAVPQAAAGSCLRSRPTCVSKSWEETIHTTMCRGFVMLRIHEDL